MSGKNCWEVKNCGRGPRGEKASEFGVCPTFSAFKAHGINRGINGGRACWVIAGTFCGGAAQGTYADKLRGCANCDFFHMVAAEEGKNLATVSQIIEKING